MKRYQRGLIATTLSMGMGMVSAHATEVVNIPWSAAVRLSELPTNTCAQVWGGFPQYYGSTADKCWLSFPLSIPVGRTIDQISVFHGTDNMFPDGGQPVFSALLDTVPLAPTWDDIQKFYWTSSNAVPSGTLDRHPLMAQVNNVYLDQFQVAPNTTYSVVVTLEKGAFISGIQVIYN